MEVCFLPLKVPCPLSSAFPEQVQHSGAGSAPLLMTWRAPPSRARGWRVAVCPHPVGPSSCWGWSSAELRTEIALSSGGHLSQCSETDPRLWALLQKQLSSHTASTTFPAEGRCPRAWPGVLLPGSVGFLSIKQDSEPATLFFERSGEAVLSPTFSLAGQEGGLPQAGGTRGVLSLSGGEPWPGGDRSILSNLPAEKVREPQLSHTGPSICCSAGTCGALGPTCRQDVPGRRGWPSEGPLPAVRTCGAPLGQGQCSLQLENGHSPQSASAGACLQTPF